MKTTLKTARTPAPRITCQTYFASCENDQSYSPEQRAEWRRLRFAHDAFGLAQAFVLVGAFDLLAPPEALDSLKADLKAAL